MGKQKIKNIIGIVNFATLCKKNSSSFVSSRELLWEDHKKKVLDKSNLDFRSNILLYHSLPNLVNNIPDDVNFKIVILYSNFLPSDIVNSLKEISSKHDAIILEHRSEDDYLDVNGSIKRAIKTISKLDDNQILFCSFRLDDDDILSTKYLHFLSKYIQIDNLNKFVSFPVGLEVSWENHKICSYNKNFIAIGLAHIGMLDTKTNLFKTTPQTVYCGISHFDIPTKFEYIIDNSPNMFIYSRHKNQDTISKFQFNNSNYTELTYDQTQESFPSILSNNLRKKILP